MSKTYLPYEPDQQLLLPAALQEWLPDDHLAYFISDVVDQLDMSEVTARYERERRGGPPYHPRMMVKVLLYGYCVGVASSRRIAQRLHEDIAFRVLAANNTPDFRTISDFRKDNVDALSGLFVQVLALCQQAGLVKLGHVALDGTKVKANARPGRLGSAPSPTLGERSRLALSCSLELGDLLVQLFLGRHQLRNLPLQLRDQPHQLVALRGREVFGLTHSQSIKTCSVPHNPPTDADPANQLPSVD